MVRFSSLSIRQGSTGHAPGRSLLKMALPLVAVIRAVAVSVRAVVRIAHRDRSASGEHARRRAYGRTDRSRTVITVVPAIGIIGIAVVVAAEDMSGIVEHDLCIGRISRLRESCSPRPEQNCACQNKRPFPSLV